MNTITLKNGSVKNEKVYGGNVFIVDGDLYILASVNSVDKFLISLESGNRYMDTPFCGDTIKDLEKHVGIKVERYIGEITLLVD